MSDPNDLFRRELLGAQKISPELQGAYQKELEAMIDPPMTTRSALPGAVLMVVLLVCAALIARTAFLHPVAPLLLVGYTILAVAFLWAAWVILKDLRNRRHSRKGGSSVSGALTFAAGTITVVALLMGLRSPSDPKSLFGAFYVFVFYFACAVWALEARIKDAQLAAREQSLRIEYRLADLAERISDRR